MSQLTRTASSVIPKALALTVTLAAVTGCEVNQQPNYMIAPQINHMLFSKAVESQMESELFDNKRTLQTPPAGTIPRGYKPTHYPVDQATAKAMGKVDAKGKADLVAVATAQAKKAGDELTNPFKPEVDVMARGKEVFQTFCAPCHGKTGAGDGLVATRGVGMPGYPLTTKGAAPIGYKDGHIFHIITYGRGNMGSYASQVDADDRWKAILWLRKLQKGGAN